MKRRIFFSLLLLHTAAGAAFAAFYQWTDSAGVVHLTDNPDNVPKSHRDKAKRIDVPDGARAPSAEAPPEPVSAPKVFAPGGHGEKWWRERFASVRGELRERQDEKARKEDRLLKLRRERTFFHRPSDRQAINALEMEIAADESRISALMNQVEILEAEATRLAVPVEWRR